MAKLPNMETLRSYLRDKPKAEFARAVGIKPVYLSQLLSAYRRPSFDLMERIEAKSGGAVPVSSWSRSGVEA